MNYTELLEKQEASSGFLLNLCFVVLQRLSKSIQSKTNSLYKTLKQLKP